MYQNTVLFARQVLTPFSPLPFLPSRSYGFTQFAINMILKLGIPKTMYMLSGLLALSLAPVSLPSRLELLLLPLASPLSLTPRLLLADHSDVVLRQARPELGRAAREVLPRRQVSVREMGRSVGHHVIPRCLVGLYCSNKLLQRLVWL